MDKLPPHNIDAEKALLGCLLIDNDAFAEVSPLVEVQDFYAGAHRSIYAEMAKILGRKGPMDMMILADGLRKAGTLDNAGGEAYLVGLMAEVSNTMFAGELANIVKDASIRRGMLMAARDMAMAAYDESQPLETAVAISEKSMREATGSMVQKGVKPVGAYLTAVMDRTEAGARGESDPGIATGFSDMDYLLKGLQKSDLLILAARPGMGKTALQTAIGSYTAVHGARVAHFSLEMSGEQQVTRMLAAEARIDYQRIQSGELYEHEWPVYMEAVGKFSQCKYFIDDTPGITVAQMRAKCLRIQAQHGLDLVMVDYLQLMRPDIRTGNKEQETGEVSRGLKELARELDCPVLAAAQLSRAVEQRREKRPVLSDLRDSGSLEQDADIVMFVYRDEYYNPDDTDRPNIAEVAVAKHRNGPTGMIELYWHGKYATFRNLKKEEINL